MFVPALDKELHKIIHFYLDQEKELLEELEELEKDVKQLDEAGLQGGDHYEDYETEDEEDDESISASRSPDATRTRVRKPSRVRRGGAPCNPVHSNLKLRLALVQLLQAGLGSAG